MAAGGMKRGGRSDHGTMAERVAATRGEPRPDVRRDPPPDRRPEPDPPPPVARPGSDALERLKHCWITDSHGRRPGLLLEWRQVVSGWQGRVVHPVPDDLGWILVEEWLPSAQLDQVETA